MIITHSNKVRPVTSSARIKSLIESISKAQLREWVEHIAKPRHYVAEARQNRLTAVWLADAFASMGLHVIRQGEYSNIIATPAHPFTKAILVGAHYDSVPKCPSADDNASAVAALLGCAAACSRWLPALPVVFVAFNREEDGLLGSKDFIGSYLLQAPFQVQCAHILEMVGFVSLTPGSQRVPPGLPVKISDKGDFLGLLANRGSNAAMNFVLRRAGTYVPELPVKGLDVKLGIEKYFPVLARSDHAPFWVKKVPALMWTDTSEFRNHNYHRHTDAPDTLDYRFLRMVTQLLTACVIQQTQDF
jgi:hypothetical protein